MSFLEPKLRVDPFSPPHNFSIHFSAYLKQKTQDIGMFSSDLEFIRSFVGIGPTGSEFGREVTDTQTGG
jgi:hypothetical protein